METNEKIDVIAAAAEDISAGTKALVAYLNTETWNAMSPEQRGKVYAAVADCSDMLGGLKDMARATMDEGGKVVGLILQPSSPKYEVPDWQALFKHLTGKYPSLTRNVLDSTLSCSYPQVRKLVAPLEGAGKEAEARLTARLCDAELLVRNDIAKSVKRCA